MIDREVQIEALWAYEIEKIHMRVTENSLISKTEVDVSFENFLSS